MMDDSERHLSVYQYQHSLKLFDQDSSNCNGNMLQEIQTMPNFMNRKNIIEKYYKSVDEF